MNLFKLFFSFLSIGVVSFGGGYSILKVMMHELIDVRGWISLEEFLDISAISQSTPGPIGLNAATFVGYKVGGLWGSLIATFSVVLAPFLLSYFVGSYIFKRRNEGVLSYMLIGLRPITVALIAGAAFTFAPLVLKTPVQAVIAILSFLLLFVFKVDPIILLISCGLLGLLLKL